MIVQDENKGDRLRNDCIVMVRDICSTLADSLEYFSGEGCLMGSKVTAQIFHAHVMAIKNLITDGYLPLHIEAFDDLDSKLQADLSKINELLDEDGFKDE